MRPKLYILMHTKNTGKSRKGNGMNGMTARNCYSVQRIHLRRSMWAMEFIGTDSLNWIYSLCVRNSTQWASIWMLSSISFYVWHGSLCSYRFDGNISSIFARECIWTGGGFMRSEMAKLFSLKENDGLQVRSGAPIDLYRISPMKYATIFGLMYSWFVYTLF